MALQAGQIHQQLSNDGVPTTLFGTNFRLPRWVRFAEKIPVVRTVIRSLLIWPKLFSAVRRCDVLHVLASSWEYFFLVVYPAVILGRLSRRWVVVNYRGGEADRFFRRYGWIIWPVFRMSDRITAPSRFVADILSHRFGASVSIVPNILNSRIFRFRTRAFLRPKLVVTRHLESTYDIPTALKAFRRVQGKYREASLWIAGTGSQEGALRNMVSEWNLKNVRFLGRVDHARLAEIYDQCDILLNASTVDNFPGALIEASAAGLAVVSTAAGGIPFIYENRRSALLVQPGDWEGLAAGVEELLESPALAAGIIAEAAAIARACDWAEVRKPLYRSYGLSIGDSEERGEPACENAAQAHRERA
jgi:glycosyltransferase involved in cell wall biosynthesis